MDETTLGYLRLLYVMKRISKKFKLFNPRGQSLVEFALILPLFVLLVVGVFDLGRAFFAYIAISNAAREGVRVFTFSPDDATLGYIENAVDFEIGASTVVNPANVSQPVVRCVDTSTNNMILVDTNAKLWNCKPEAPISVTLTYSQTMILSFFFSGPLVMEKTAQMMVP